VGINFESWISPFERNLHNKVIEASGMIIAHAQALKKPPGCRGLLNSVMWAGLRLYPDVEFSDVPATLAQRIAGTTLVEVEPESVLVTGVIGAVEMAPFGNGV